MHIEVTKKIIVSNSRQQTDKMEHDSFLEYLHGAIKNSDIDMGKRHKIALIKIVLDRMSERSLRGAKIFVEDAFGQ